METKETSGKFSKLVKRDGDSIISDRGSRIIKSAEIAQKQLINKLTQQLTKKEDEREFLLDQSPDNRYSLNVGQSFDAENFAKAYQALSIEITNLQVEMAIAKANFEELFGKKHD